MQVITPMPGGSPVFAACARGAGHPPPDLAPHHSTHSQTPSSARVSRRCSEILGERFIGTTVLDRGQVSLLVMKCSSSSLWIFTLARSISSVVELFQTLADQQVSESLSYFLTGLRCSSLTGYWKWDIPSVEQKLFPLPASLPSSPRISLIMRTCFFNLLDFSGAAFWESSKWLESTARSKPEGWETEVINIPRVTLHKRCFHWYVAVTCLEQVCQVWGDQRFKSLLNPTLKLSRTTRSTHHQARSLPGTRLRAASSSTADPAAGQPGPPKKGWIPASLRLRETHLLSSFCGPSKPGVLVSFLVCSTHTHKCNRLSTLFLNQYIYTPYRYECSENPNYLLGALLHL